MYIIAIAWLYVTVLMAFAERSAVAGVLTFVFYGLLPMALFFWLFGTPLRRRRRRAAEAAADSAMAEGSEKSVGVTDQLANQPDRSDTQANQ